MSIKRVIDQLRNLPQQTPAVVAALAALASQVQDSVQEKAGSFNDLMTQLREASPVNQEQTLSEELQGLASDLAELFGMNVRVVDLDEVDSRDQNADADAAWKEQYIVGYKRLFAEQEQCIIDYKRANNDLTSQLEIQGRLLDTSNSKLTELVDGLRSAVELIDKLEVLTAKQHLITALRRAGFM